jgi:hypothetical protein
MAVNNQIKEKLKCKLEAAKGELAGDLSKSKVEREIRSVKEVDGKLQAEFSVEGLHTDAKGAKQAHDVPFHEHYRNWTKIFDGWKDLSKYGEAFYNASVEELKEMVNTGNK